METSISRFSDAHGSTVGIFRINGKFACYSLEDGWTVVKIPGQSRINAGRYPIRYRQEVTPLTTKYRQMYPWFKWHLEICDVVDYKNVYLHIGNDNGHTDGCVLLGDSINNNQNGPGFLGNSTRAFQRVYELICEALDRGEQVWITIRDEEFQPPQAMAA